MYIYTVYIMYMYMCVYIYIYMMYICVCIYRKTHVHTAYMGFAPSSMAPFAGSIRKQRSWTMPACNT